MTEQQCVVSAGCTSQLGLDYSYGVVGALCAKDDDAHPEQIGDCHLNRGTSVNGRKTTYTDVYTHSL